MMGGRMMGSREGDRMSHTAFRVGPPVELEADYVVVGSGAGGATAAVTLARGGAKVAVVEAGPWRDPDDYPHSVYGAMRDMLDAWGSNFTRGRAFWPIVQGSLVGGSTVINSAICVRTPGDIFDQWKREHGVGGPALAESIGRIQDELERELSVEEVPLASRGPHNLLAQQGADRLGYESHTMRRYVKGCQGAGQCLQGCKKDRKQSLNRTYVPEVVARGGLVVSCAPVRRVDLEGRRAVGVSGRFRHPRTRERGADFHVRAKKGVLVAASAVHSPVLLMRSTFLLFLRQPSRKQPAGCTRIIAGMKPQVVGCPKTGAPISTRCGLAGHANLFALSPAARWDDGIMWSPTTAR